MSILYDSVKTLVGYLILVAVVMNLLGTSSYKKYIGMFTGMLLIFIIISPLLKLFHLTETYNYQINENFLKVEAQEMNDDLIIAEEDQKNYIFKEYKVQLTKQIEDRLKAEQLYLIDCKIQIEEDMENEFFGRLTKLHIVAGDIPSKDEEILDKIKKVKVNIDKVEISRKTEESDSLISQLDSALEIKMKNELSAFYDINSEDIIIDIE